MAAGKASGKAAASFDEIIRAGRQKRKNEELASQILGKNRKAGAGKKTQNATPGGSLASRIGVTKRSAPTPAKPKKNNNNKPVVSAAPPAAPKGPRAKSANRRRPDEERLLTALNPANGQSTVRDNTGGLSIKGASSGPFVIVGSNFAPGTTAADIQSALEPVAGPALNCWITGNYPAVTAEITFAEKWSAENTVANFHNQKADGRVLSMRWKAAGASAEPSFNDLREQADQQRRRLRGADPAIQDGTYGFGAQNSYGRGGRANRGQRGSGAYQNTQDQGLYSDEMMVDAPSQDSRYRSRRHR